MQFTPWAFEQAAAMVAIGVAVVAAILWIRRGRRATRRSEVLFVGRAGVFGPELYLVGKRVRRLLSPQDVDEHPSAAFAFAERTLTEVMRCRPAGRLVRALADARLEPLPGDGFVLSASDIESWLDSRKGRFERRDEDDSPRAG
jgi:hypothetical protein